MTKYLGPRDIKAGMEIPTLTKQPTTQQLLAWAEVSGDHNPIHCDNHFAVNAGLPGVIVPGQLLMAFLGQMVTDWLGDLGELKRLTVSYKSMNFPGNTITCRGAVQEIVGEGMTLRVWVENTRFEKTVVGSAVVAVFS